MTFQDIFRSSFLENVSAISMLDMALSILLAFALGLFIFFIYKKTYCGIMYSPGFGVTLIALTLITNLLILAVTSNIVLSLGMVGALSIVRFRTAIKEPMDIAFLFWSIAAGIVLAAGFIPLAVFGSMFIGLILLIFSSRRDTDAPYILVVHCDSDEAEQRAAGLIRDRAAAAFWGDTGSFKISSMVFHSPQPGHFPTHLAVSKPHWLHWYMILLFPAMVHSVLFL